MKISIKKRILAWLLLLQTILSVAGCIALLAYTRNQQLTAFDADLNAHMETVIANIEPEHGKLQLDQQQSIPPEHLFLVRDSTGNVIAKNGLDHLVSVGGRRTITFAHSGTLYRGLQIRSFELQDEEGLKTPARLDLLYAMPFAAANAHFHAIVVTAVVLTLTFLCLSALGTWWAVARGLRPLHQLAERAGAIDASNWRFEVPEQASGVAELLPLAGALRDLTTRLKASFERERRFFSDASHELKTSVAIQKSTLQLMEQGPHTIAEYEGGVARALEDTARTEKLVANMLSLGVEASPKGTAAVSRLSDSLDLAIAELQALADASQIELIPCGSSEVDVTGAPEDLKVAFVNVLENAVQHSGPGGKVEIKTRSTLAGSIEVSVSDTGAGIPPGELPHVFERFYRSDRSRARKTGGFGLGLAIAKSLVERNLGSIRIESTPDRGTCVFIQLKQVATKIAAH